MGEVIRSTSLLDHPMVTRETWDQYTAADHDRWSRLFKRQTEILKNRACDEILESVSTLHINDKQIPKFSEINEILQKPPTFPSFL
jgi:phenylalanine-4-hydroxylase